jgi:hypothetical protein
MAASLATLKRLWAALLIVAIGFCPLAQVCPMHKGGGAAAEVHSMHDAHAHHGDHDAPALPALAGGGDGCMALQHCAPFTWIAGVQSAVGTPAFAALKFPRPDSLTAVGIDDTPESPPPKAIG